MRAVILPVSCSTNSSPELQSYDKLSPHAPMATDSPRMPFPPWWARPFRAPSPRTLLPSFQRLLLAVWSQQTQFLSDFSPDSNNAAPASSDTPWFFVCLFLRGHFALLVARFCYIPFRFLGLYSEMQVRHLRLVESF